MWRRDEVFDPPCTPTFYRPSAAMMSVVLGSRQHVAFLVVCGWVYSTISIRQKCARPPSPCLDIPWRHPGRERSAHHGSSAGASSCW
ncbi:hypothetical protein CALVIDRAFT_390651 [Calocera viscosa TUFC12733]|uniref:Uncharacterized protein n=1 Tax=Calocera viscosa (strain TUFC12733) TaxID=1330018 RepID=A0A167GG79_CALVF|nr:hypothetical protein CALVIDRAFT_390651 [Calocera viscosa TUFC12733]